MFFLTLPVSIKKRFYDLSEVLKVSCIDLCDLEKKHFSRNMLNTAQKCLINTVAEDRKSSRLRSKSRTRWRKVSSAERGISRIDEEDELEEGTRLFERLLTPALRAENIRSIKSNTPKIFNLTKLVRKLLHQYLFYDL